MAEQNKINIENKEYAIDSLSDQAKAMIANIRVTDQEISRLQTQLAIHRTARAAYAQTLKQALPQDNSATALEIDPSIQ